MLRSNHLLVGLTLGWIWGSALAQEGDGQEAESIAATSEGSATNRALDRVDSVDEFFVDDEQSTFKDDRTRVRLRLDTDYIEGHGWDFSPKVKLHLALPNSARTRLVLNDAQGPDVDEQSPNADEEQELALRWIARQSETGSGLSLDGGVWLKKSKLEAFGRINAAFSRPLGNKWTATTTNRLYYLSVSGWRNDFRQYFNRALGEDWLLRSLTRVDYLEANDYNPFLSQKFSLFHQFRDRSAIAYELYWSRHSAEDSPFDPDEIDETKDNFQHYIAGLRYRQKFLRPWFFVEFWPLVAWPEERDYKTTFAARIRLEVNLGGGADVRLDE